MTFLNMMHRNTNYFIVGFAIVVAFLCGFKSAGLILGGNRNQMAGERPNLPTDKSVPIEQSIQMCVDGLDGVRLERIVNEHIFAVLNGHDTIRSDKVKALLSVFRPLEAIDAKNYGSDATTLPVMNPTARNALVSGGGPGPTATSADRAEFEEYVRVNARRNTVRSFLLSADRARESALQHTVQFCIQAYKGSPDDRKALEADTYGIPGWTFLVSLVADTRVPK